jgi:hypothetical protein
MRRVSLLLLVVACSPKKGAPPPPPAVKAPDGGPSRSIAAVPPTTPPPTPPPGKAFAGERPRFSPDGKKVAYFGGPDGAHRIYTMASDGTDVKEVPSPPGDSRDPTWASSGLRLVFANNSAGTYDLYVSGEGTGV